MKISEIYEKYKIMPQLQTHMLRVTAVAKTITDSFNKELDIKTVISASLLHDLGNMAKIKLELFPEFAQPLGVKYWGNILTEFKHKYGNDDYTATYTIIKELGILDKVYNLIRGLEFAKSPQTEVSKSYELKICLYSDARVAPHGVVSLRDRLKEVKTRYIKNKGVSQEKFDQISKSLYSIEKQIFTHCNINPTNITEEKVRPLIGDLKNYNIKTK